MAKLTVYRRIFTLVAAILGVFPAVSGQYRLDIRAADRPVSFITDSLDLKTSFSDREACKIYMERVPALLLSKGYPFASVDTLQTDSAGAYAILYIGEPVRYLFLKADSAAQPVLEAIGWGRRSRHPLDATRLHDLQERMLDYMENNGYPFAGVQADSIYFSGDSMYAVLKLDAGPLYSVDSIRNYGSASISSRFLQQYLGMKNGSIYSKEKLGNVSARLRELPYLQEKQPWNLSLLGTGSILNLYLDPKKSSEINVLLGLLPANDQLQGNKMLVTGEANINLRNALGGGEAIGLNWQQIQVKSPRLNLLFQQPYLFGSPFGINLNFDLFKKDSSFVNISMLAGVTYSLSTRQTGTVYIEHLVTNLLTIDTFTVKNSRKLPPEADVSSVNLGVNYEWFNTDYRFNPRKGNELTVNVAVGTKQIRKNDVIVKLYDASEPSFDFNSLYDTLRLKTYQFRMRGKFARYFPLGHASTLKAALNAGWFQSPSVFRNELFQIGGYKLLRGFDEESIFSSAYGVATAEYRYLLGQNSFLAAFVDYGATANHSEGKRLNDRFLGAGLGMAFETKAGIFNISVAAGKRDEEKFNIRQSKIHLGYVNYF